MTPEELQQRADHVLEALAAAVAYESGRTQAAADIDTHMQVLCDDGWWALLGAMRGWVGALGETCPGRVPASDEVVGLAAVNARTGRQVNPDGVVPPALLAGGRVLVAFANGEHDSAAALFYQAVKDGHGYDVVTFVLAVVARLISTHYTKPTIEDAQGGEG